MSWGDVTFDADLVANVFGDLDRAPALHAGDVELGKSTSGHQVMIAVEKPTPARQAQAASVSARPYQTPRLDWPSQVLDAGGG